MVYHKDMYACVDSVGEEWPDHDFPPVEEGNTCRRCNAEALDDEEEEEL